MILDDLRQWLDKQLKDWAESQSLGTLPVYGLEEPPAGIDADFACNLPLLLAKPLKKSPRAIAQEIQTALKPGDFVESVSIAGAGFLNFKLKLARWQQEVKTVLEQKEAYGRQSHKHHQKILIEFVSANPTGPMHVGHGRGAALGDSLALILSHMGHQVSREFYVNDAGTQVQMLGESLKARCLEQQGKPLVLPENGYHGDYLVPVAKEFVEKQADKLEDSEAVLAFVLSRMIDRIRQDLEDFGVKFDTWFSERALVKKGAVDDYVKRLRDRGFVKEHDDATWFEAPGEEGEEKDKDRVLKRRDGRWTYFATDIAYHADKFSRGYDRLIDVWGADHHGYVARVKGSMQALGNDPNKLHVLLYQLVSLLRNGQPVSMSKRTGDFITLREVLEEVGRDACRFFFAMRGPNTALDFDLELAKKQSQDNPVYYVQYAHARICAIFRGAKEKGVAVSSTSDLSLLKETEERDLMRRLADFPRQLEVCAEEDSPHPLANYLLALCRQFHHFYDHHRVLGDDPALTQSRLAVLQAVRGVLAQGLKLLGVSAPESM